MCVFSGACVRCAIEFSLGIGFIFSSLQCKLPPCICIQSGLVAHVAVMGVDSMHQQDKNIMQAGQRLANALGAPQSAAAPSQQQTSNTIAGMTPKQLYGILKALKEQIEENPDKGRAVLAQNLHLAKALFQAQIILGMVNPDPPMKQELAGDAAVATGAQNGQANGSAQLPAQSGQPVQATPAAAKPELTQQQIGTRWLRCACTVIECCLAKLWLAAMSKCTNCRALCWSWIAIFLPGRSAALCKCEAAHTPGLHSSCAHTRPSCHRYPFRMLIEASHGLVAHT